MKKTCLALLLAAVASGSLFAETVRVAVAASFTAPIKELTPIYEKATGDKPRSRTALPSTCCSPPTRRPRPRP